MPDEVLDLSDVVVGDFVIRSRDKTREWRVDNDLPCRTAWNLLTYGDQWDSGAVDQTAFTATMGAMLAILQRQQPQTTLDDVIDAFSIVDIQRVVRFLQARVGQLPEGESAPTPTQTTPPPSSSTEPTPMRKKSASKSGAAS